MTEAHYQLPTRRLSCKGEQRSEAWTKADQVVHLYAQGIGHKTIAKQLEISPRIARVILIERGAWRPGSLRGSEHHRKAIGAATRARVPAWRREVNRLNEERRAKINRRYADLPLFRRPDPRTTPRGEMPEAMRLQVRVKEMQAYYANPQERMINLLGKRTRKALLGIQCSRRTAELLGTDTEGLRAHIESLWQPGMSWDNYANGKRGWCLDHIKPFAAHDLTKEDERRACCHYLNTQPLWGEENMRKGSLWQGVRHARKAEHAKL